MKISYDCEELIEEITADIEEFGENEPCYIFFEKVKGYEFATNYDFVEDEMPLEDEEKLSCKIVNSTLGEALKLFKSQDNVLENVNKIFLNRLKSGITQSQLAEKIGVTQKDISRWESKLRNPKLVNLKKIANALEISINDLI